MKQGGKLGNGSILIYPKHKFLPLILGAFLFIDLFTSIVKSHSPVDCGYRIQISSFEPKIPWDFFFVLNITLILVTSHLVILPKNILKWLTKCFFEGADTEF